MTEPTSDLQYRVERPATDPLELEADAPHHRRRGRVRPGRPGGEHAARLPVGLGRVHRLVRRPWAGPAAAGTGALAVAVIGPGRARTRARLGGSRAAWRRVAGRAGQSRTTNTGQLAWWTHRSQTDPSVKLPCPRAPTTSRLAFSAMSISTRAALPCTNSRRTSVGRWSPNTSVSASSR